jgi:N-acetylglucosaminyldiphosphoundecaprenol N-acetyl-beta-D-mannosaminyltransferase
LLRAWDISLAALLGLLLCLPYGLARLVSARVPADLPYSDAGPARRHRLQLPSGLIGRLLGGLGAASWPVVFDVLAGRLAWVGPTSLDHLPEAVAAHGVRPGVVTLWGLRRRTAVAYASEVECDHEYLAQRGLVHDLGLFLRACVLAPLPMHSAAPQADRVRVCDVAFDNLDMNDALQRLDGWLSGTATQQVSFVNPACVNIAAHDRGYRRALGRAALVLPDGIGIKVAADILGQPLRQNVNGTDLFPRLCALMGQRKSRLYLLGGQPGVADAVAGEVRQRWPDVQIVGVAHGFFSVADEGQVVAAVKASRADVVLVARGVPSQDVFIDRYLPQFGARVVMGVGGLFDFVAGRINRAPQWMRDSGLEWVYRLLQEPGRMWRRYLLGNFSFLARVLMQRMGWRQPAVDTVAAEARAAVPAGAAVSAVLFACQATDDSIPAPRSLPASLLPLGCASFLERALEHLAEAGVRRVHLVVSHQPEALRHVVGMGERWGLAVQWHLAKDEARPYGVLSLMDWQGVGRVVVGHAERWIGRQAVHELAGRQAVAWVDERRPQAWSGWASATPAELRQWPAEGPWETLEAHLLQGEAPGQGLICTGARSARAGTAADLLAAQAAVAALDPCQAPARQLPGSWIKTPWGGMSPSARVHPQAVIEGPVLLGPGCLVDAHARIGPDVVLERDVVVTRGSSVAHAVVLPNTFIGEGLSVQGGIACGNRLYPLNLGVTIELPVSDGLLMALRAGDEAPAPGWLARVAAALALGLLWLPGVLDGWLRSVRGLPPRAVRQAVATGLSLPLAAPGERPLWVVTEPAPRTRFGHWLSLVKPLGDVVMGRRTWLGRRPLTLAQWDQLSEDWRQILRGQAVGVVHAPAWQDGGPSAVAADGSAPGASLTETVTAADVFLAVQSDASVRRRLLLGQLLLLGPDRRSAHGAAVVVPPTWRAEPGPASGPASEAKPAAVR